MMLEHHEIPEPRPRRWLKRRLAVRRPKIRGIAERLLYTIVEIIAERADMRFDLDNGEKVVPEFDDQIPVLGGTKIAG
jgi:hypothetical protein